MKYLLSLIFLTTNLNLLHNNIITTRKANKKKKSKTNDTKVPKQVKQVKQM